MNPRRGAVWIWVALAALLVQATPAHAVEYRLLVANVFDTALTSFVTAKDLSYGATGPGLVRLETVLDTGELDLGAMPAGRPLVGVPESIARAWGAVAVRADIARGGIGAGRWDEVRWQGAPGERSIWLVRATGNAKPQHVMRVTLEGSGPVRLYLPFTRTGSERLAVLQVPQPLIEFYENRGNVWDKWVARGLDLGQGVGAVVGINNNNALNADLVYLVVQQGDRPTTYRAVISWLDRNIDREGIDARILNGSGRH